MLREMRIFIAALFITPLISLSACVTQQMEPASATVAPSPTLTPSPTQWTPPPPTLARDADYLPILDASLEDETFRMELKDRLGLSGEQIDRLRAVAREENSLPRETADESATTAVLTRAEERITAIIGAPATEYLYALARVRWNNEAARAAGERESPTPGETPVVTVTTGGAMPNAVPNDTRIVVNAPAYRMDIFANGKLMKSYRIGIGYPEFPLPIGMRTANEIIFNPTWTPPDEPWVESPSSKVKVGQKVEAGSPLNPLGLVKIPIGSPSLIHGGKSVAQLGGFASHGCVGLTDAQVVDLSKRLARLDGIEITDKQIAGYKQNRTKTKNFALQQPIPVELRYETIVVEGGKLYIYRDVYEHGTNTEANLRDVLGAHGLTLENLSERERSQVGIALDRMGRNAAGVKVPAATSTPSVNGAAGSSPSATPTKLGNEGSASRKVTRRIKGEKEMVIEIAALAGKGYSAPVGLDNGKERPRAVAVNSRKQSN
jgi:lipoprotein-anchoring transpeptidase ErfK/SrfK